MGRVSIYTVEDTPRTYTEDDFFIVTRASVLQNQTKLPEDIDPYATIDYAGYIQAYIFRGDTLDKGGFRF